jgi:hypothetical protein
MKGAEIHFNFCHLSESPRKARFLHDAYDAIKHFFVHVSYCIQSKFKVARPIKALSHNALYSFSENWRRHMDVFMNFIFLVRLACQCLLFRIRVVQCAINAVHFIITVPV